MAKKSILDIEVFFMYRGSLLGAPLAPPPKIYRHIPDPLMEFSIFFKFSFLNPSLREATKKMPKKFTHCVSRQISQKILPLFSLKNGDILKFSRVYYPNSTNEGNCPRSLLNFFTFSKDGHGIYGS